MQINPILLMRKSKNKDKKTRKREATISSKAKKGKKINIL